MRLRPQKSPGTAHAQAICRLGKTDHQVAQKAVSPKNCKYIGGNVSHKFFVIEIVIIHWFGKTQRLVKRSRSEGLPPFECRSAILTHDPYSLPLDRRSYRLLLLRVDLRLGGMEVDWRSIHSSRRERLKRQRLPSLKAGTKPSEAYL